MGYRKKLGEKSIIDAGIIQKGKKYKRQLETKLNLPGINSTCLVREMLGMTQRTQCRVKHGGGIIMLLGFFFLLGVKDDFTTLRGQWMWPCTI